MLDTIRPTVAADKLSRSSVGANSDCPSEHNRRAFFFVADLVFLVLAGIGATLTMHLIHQLEWPFFTMCLVGMVAAMVVQTLMAIAVAPLLGSIESMAPSMIIGMASPMTICVLHLFGCESTGSMATAIGAAFAVSMFVFMHAYNHRCRHELRPAGQFREREHADRLEHSRATL